MPPVLNALGNDVFALAKQQSLNDFIQRTLGASPRVHGKHKRYPTCVSAECRSNINRHSVRLSVSDDRTFHCFRCGVRGSIIDAAMWVWGLDTPLDAAQALTGQPRAAPRYRPRAAPADPSAEPGQAEALRHALQALRALTDQSADDAGCLRYLTRDRGIPRSIVEHAQARRLLDFLPSSRARALAGLRDHIGQALLVRAGLWATPASRPWIVQRPIVFFFPGMTAAEFRLNRAPRDGEPKSLRKGRTDYPWFWEGEDPTRALVVEGFIDLLSAVALGYPGHVIGVPGCSTWAPAWFDKLRARGVRHVDIGFDDDHEAPDNPGQRWAGLLADCLTERGIAHRITPPAAGDMNALLLARRAPCATPER